MPMFEFHCSECERDFEELVRNPRETTRLVCAHCGSRRVDRKLSVFSARSAATNPATRPAGGGCGRCGDPAGPCGL